MDDQAPSKGLIVSVPWEIQTDPKAKPLNTSLAQVVGKSVVYASTLSGDESVYTHVALTKKPASMNVIEINDTRLGAGVRYRNDYPLDGVGNVLNLWSIRSVVAVEPFLTLKVAAGETKSWTTTYEYYALSEEQ